MKLASLRPSFRIDGKNAWKSCRPALAESQIFYIYRTFMNMIQRDPLRDPIRAYAHNVIQRDPERDPT